MTILPRVRLASCSWAAVLVLAAFATSTPAQCDLQSSPGAGIPGTDGLVRASCTWDPDGTGPAQPVVVLGGDFTYAGNVSANRIVMHDVQTGVWSTLGTGMDGSVYALATLPTGELVAGGLFTTAGGVQVNNIARWNGSSWAPFGAGTTLAIPADASLIGLTVRTQVLSIELTPQLTTAAITSTNALDFTLGVF